jgi:predicted RNase H-like nuclease (RuvC/YqgF family)
MELQIKELREENRILKDKFLETSNSLEILKSQLSSIERVCSFLSLTRKQF